MNVVIENGYARCKMCNRFVGYITHRTIGMTVEFINVQLFEFKPMFLELDPNDHSRQILMTKSKIQPNHLKRKRVASISSDEPKSKVPRKQIHKSPIKTDEIILEDYIDSPIRSPNLDSLIVMRAITRSK